MKNHPFIKGSGFGLPSHSEIDSFFKSEYPSNKNIFARFQQKYCAGSGHKLTKTLKNGDSVEGFKVIEKSGHSSGHISFFRESDGVLILGDVATSMDLVTTVSGLHLPPAVFTSNKEENIKSLKE